MRRSPVAIPVPGPPPAIRPPSASRHRLDNGLTVRTAERPRLPIVDSLLVLPLGASADPPAAAGQASLLAELLDSGTTTRSQIDIARAFDALGARVSIHADWDFTALAMQVLPDRFGAALTVLSDVVRNAAFPGPEFERGRAERLAAILQDREDPEALAGSAIASAIYGANHVYGRPRYGSYTTVERLDRTALVQSHRGRYRPGAAALVVAGAVSADAVLRDVGRAFDDWTASGAAVIEDVPAVARERTRVHLVDRPDAPQSEVRVGTVGTVRTSVDYFPLVVLNTILGGSFTSRLNTRLRERGGYTYGAFSAFSFRRHAGPFIAGAAVFTDVTAKAVAAIIEEIARVGTEVVPAAELERAKRYLRLGMVRGFESNGGLAARFAESELHDLGDDWWSRYGNRIEAIDGGAVQDVAVRYLDPERLSVVVVGDAAAVRGPLQSLDIGPVIDTTVE
jgi:zinc protease